MTDGKSSKCTNNVHSVKLLNLSSGEEICYSVVVVEGVIKSNDECMAPMDVTIEHMNGPLCGPPITIHKISKNMTFKVLLKLELGMNKFIVNFCTVRKEIILHFRPRQTNFCVIPVYVICKGHDGRFQAPECEDNSIESACERISTGVHLIQSLFAERLQKAGYGRLTFQLQSDLDPMAPDCHILYSDVSVEEAHSALASTLWTWLGREIMLSHFGSKERKYIAFLSSTQYNGNHIRKDTLTHEEIVESTKGYVSLGGGGLALVGTGCLYTWATSIEEVVPRLLSEVAVDTKLFMDESNYRGTYGGCYSTTLGAVAHEMGHTFDLGHTAHGIMGPDYHNIHCLLLPEESTLTCVKAPSKLNLVRDTLLSSTKQVKHMSFEGEEKYEALVQELQVVWSVPKSQLTCENTDLLQHKNPKVIKKFGKQQISEEVGHSKGNRATHTFYTNPDTSGEALNCLSPILDRNDISPFWATSCLSILALHRWFNPNATKENSGGLTFNKAKRQITSEYGLGVIEIRDTESLSILHWKFSRESAHKEFTIPSQYIYPKAETLWVIDQVGNSMTFDLKKSERQT